MGTRARRVEYRVFTKDECEMVHQASLETLERTGCKIEAEEALDLLKQAGSHVEGDRVRIPSSVVEKALQSAPQKIELYSRLGQRAMVLEGWSWREATLTMARDQTALSR
jgi:trimethylamine--corrinoid protein Co-methyltransferase